MFRATQLRKLCQETGEFAGLSFSEASLSQAHTEKSFKHSYNRADFFFKCLVSVCVCFVKLALLMSCRILLHPHIPQHHPRSDCYFWNLECENHPIRKLWIWLLPLDLELKTQS